MNRPIFLNQRTATLDGDLISFGTQESAQRQLRQLWHWSASLLKPSFGPPMDVRQTEDEGLVSTPAKREQEATPAPPAKPEVALSEKWLFGFGKSFLKAVDSTDRKLQGRILQALADIAEAPLACRGDTVKPLSGDMNGFWRYRIGDFRLIYYPDEATHTVTLCDFDSRGSVYD